MIPEPTNRRKAKRDSSDTNGHRSINYRDLAPVYLRQGYPAPIPLPQGRKSPPPNGFTGHHNTRPPSDEQIEEWRRARGDDGIAFVLQDGQIVIDVDNYAKGEWPAGTGAATIAELAQRAGCELPIGPKLRNRTDGSEKRPFRVPQRLKFRKGLGPCVDVVTPTHRYVNAGINPDTGNPERWFDADDRPLDEPPPPDTWPDLPEAWLPLCIQGYRDGPTSLATEEQAQAWLDGMPEGPVGPLVQEQLDYALAGLRGCCRNPNHVARHDCSQEHIRWLVEMGAAGLTGVPGVLVFLRDQFIGAVGPDRNGGADEAAAEFDGMVAWAARVCRPDVFYATRAMDRNMAAHGEPIRLNDTTPDDVPEPANDSGGRYRLVSARELAEPVEPMRWLVRGIWPERSAGVLAGDKKSMKTWTLQTIAVAVAAGRSLFEKYHVTSPGPVLYLAGEGGRSTFANRHQVIAARYYIDPETLRDLPFGAEFGVGALDNSEFTEAVKRHLDTLQPKLVILDPLYAYHPSDVEVSNLYARGPMLANLRALIGDEAALIVGDHFNKTAPERLDLDNVAQAGMAQWADSWILQKHRDAPNLDDDKYWLQVETGTRRGGGKRLEVDWTLDRDKSDPDVIAWTGVDWECRPMDVKSPGARADDTMTAILQVVADHPFELTETSVLKLVGGNHAKRREAFQSLKINGGVVIKNCTADEGGRSVNRDRVGLGPNAESLRRKRFRREDLQDGSEAAKPTDTDDGTGSERVAE
ncbi:hypothetical protein MYCOZU2_02274 [Mycobacterium intracellulare subsp. chimaera]|uniref:DNA primase/polymerase bifunctional N-terminal domain-containing protein n=2 Tax=Mycobacterium TaxID=1763 RepID=A0A7U5MJG0_MYCIT|nr:hypothetical protein MYCOZU2_02274 [Mycobacterium intracellulare subsp. chimaera]ASQ85907.1 hypothetical protein CE197_09855 [Mycobacterium intracellulare subsp. chimaera]